MFELNSVGKGNIKHGFGFAVIGRFHLSLLEFDSLSFGKERNFGHTFSIGRYIEES